MDRRWMRLLGAVFALTLLAAACGGEEETPPDQNGGSPSESPAESPADGGGGGGSHDRGLRILTGRSLRDGGATIEVTNIGETSHTFTTDDEAIDETIGAGETIDIDLTGATSGGFHCRFHPQMVGTLTVG